MDLANCTVRVERGDNEQVYEQIRREIDRNERLGERMRVTTIDSRYPLTVSSHYVEVPLRSLFPDEQGARDFQYNIEKCEIGAASHSMVAIHTGYGMIRFRIRRGDRTLRLQQFQTIYEAVRILQPRNIYDGYSNGIVRQDKESAIEMGHRIQRERGLLEYPMMPLACVPISPPKKTTKELDEKHFKVETIKLKQDD